MITARLEDMIWDGRAKYKTWTIGTGSAGLNVKENQTIIITQVDYFGFLDSDEDTVTTNPEIWRSKMNKQITFYDKTKRHSLLARSFYSEFQGLLSSHHTFDTYFIFSENILCNIASIPPVSGWTIVNGRAPVKSQQQFPPLGYGNDSQLFGVPLVIINTEFNSLTNDEAISYPDTRPSKDVAYNDFLTSIAADTQVANPNQNVNELGETQFPLMTVHYVEINERLTAKFA